VVKADQARNATSEVYLQENWICSLFDVNFVDRVDFDGSDVYGRAHQRCHLKSTISTVGVRNRDARRCLKVELVHWLIHLQSYNLV
jgi:hypothetical protein